MGLRVCFVLIIVAIMGSVINSVSAQSGTEDHALYLLSNLESLPADAPELDALQQFFEKETTPCTILINGDFVDKNGLGTNPSKDDLAKIDRLISMVGRSGQLIFIPGDREWDNGGLRGLKKVKALEKYLESKNGKGKVIFPQKGCLGPEAIDIGTNTTLIAINTQWFIEDEIGPQEEDTDCGFLNETEFWGEIEDLLGDSENKNLVIAGHHPALSFGQYAGYRLTKQHFSPPLIGSFIASYHQNVGGRKDLNQKNIRRYSNQLLGMTHRFPGSIIVSGHEYDTQLLFKDETYHINSGGVVKANPVGRGKETIYRNKKPGFAKLIFEANGKVLFQTYNLKKNLEIVPVYEKMLFDTPCLQSQNVIPANMRYNPCLQVNSDLSSDHSATGTAIAGAEYADGFLKRTLLGKHYRSTWAKPVHNIPYLDLDTTFGGLTPYAKGGGAQTVSVKFNSGDGRRFAFRSINKTATKRMNKDLRRGVYGKITQDKTSHQHPYSSTILAPLMDRLEIPHSMPKLYLLPDSPKLGAFRKEFAGMYGTLELKPKGKNKQEIGFLDADKVVTTFDMYRKMLDDHDHKIDADQFVKARIFDIWVSDWDRHVKNWKWLAYKDDGTTTYKPFPKDRDKALSLYQGLYFFIEILRIDKDKVNFRKSYYGLKYLNFKNKTMDRWLANSYTYEDWMAAVNHFQEAMSDQAIDEGISSLPEEAQPLVRKRISEVLIARREKLPKAMTKYYKMLAKYIDLIGSNSREYFELHRLENGDVEAKIFKLKKDGRKGKQLYHRLIKKSETKEIRLHGLGKKDRFLITGSSNKSILIRIIGGKGKDIIEDQSTVKGARKMTKVYDKRGQDQLVLNSEAKKMKTDKILTFESFDFFNYDYYKILPNFAYNTDDGLTLGVNGSYTRQGFNKPDFSQKYNYSASFTTNRNYNISLQAQYRHVIDKWDLIAGVSAASRDKTFQNFYGFGNEVALNDSLLSADFYRNNTGAAQFHLGFNRTFWNKSNVNITAVFDQRNVEAILDDEGEVSIYNQLPEGNGLGEITLIGPRFNLNVDLRDNGNFPTKGLQLLVNNFSFWNMDDEFDAGGKLETELSAFFTAGVRVPVTLALRSGHILSYGDTPFYYKAYIGQQTNHRGFRRNRYGGDSAAYLNTDLRFHFGKVITPIVPIKYGVFGLFDVGRTWLDGEDSDRLHHAYGGGLYLVPYAESFNLTLTAAKSSEGETLFSFQVGFFVR